MIALCTNRAEPREDSSDKSSQEEDINNDDDDIDIDMEHVYAIINSGYNEETDMFDPEAE